MNLSKRLNSISPGKHINLNLDLDNINNAQQTYTNTNGNDDTNRTISGNNDGTSVSSSIDIFKELKVRKLVPKNTRNSVQIPKENILNIKRKFKLNFEQISPLKKQSNQMMHELNNHNTKELYLLLENDHDDEDNYENNISSQKTLPYSTKNRSFKDKGLILQKDNPVNINNNKLKDNKHITFSIKDSKDSLLSLKLEDGSNGKTSNYSIRDYISSESPVKKGISNKNNYSVCNKVVVEEHNSDYSLNSSKDECNDNKNNKIYDDQVVSTSPNRKEIPGLKILKEKIQSKGFFQKICNTDRNRNERNDINERTSDINTTNKVTNLKFGQGKLSQIISNISSSKEKDKNDAYKLVKIETTNMKSPIKIQQRYERPQRFEKEHSASKINKNVVLEVEDDVNNKNKDKNNIKSNIEYNSYFPICFTERNETFANKHIVSPRKHNSSNLALTLTSRKISSYNAQSIDLDNKTGFGIGLDKPPINPIFSPGKAVFRAKKYTLSENVKLSPRKEFKDKSLKQEKDYDLVIKPMDFEGIVLNKQNNQNTLLLKKNSKNNDDKKESLPDLNKGKKLKR